MTAQRGDVEVIALPLGEFTFPADEPWAGQTGVVVGYAVRHPGGVFLFDTGLGFGNDALENRYRPRPRPLGEVLDDAGVDLAEITAAANCHLHADHAGQNSALGSVPIYVQPAEWAAASADPEYTVMDWVDFPGARYKQVEGDHEVAPGIRIFATPGHSPGHQSIVVDTLDGPTLLAGQAVYSHGEWIGLPDAREGRTGAPDEPAYARSVARLRTINPRRVLFGHDRRGWPS